MAYVINRYNGVELASVEDGTLDNSTSLKLIGKNFFGYGEAQNENFVHLLENFSNPTSPLRPLSGQIWYDSDTKKIKFYTGTAWKSTSGFELSSTEPTGLTNGDCWWDTEKKQLHVFNGVNFVLIGPQVAKPGTVTQLVSRQIYDVNNVLKSIIEVKVEDEVVAIISKETFEASTTTLDLSKKLPSGFDSYIRQGVVLANTGPNGITNTTHRFWGTASNADRLGGIVASDYVTQSELENYNFPQGLTVTGDLRLYVDGDQGILEHGNKASSKLVFRVTNSSQQLSSTMIVESSKITPAQTNTIDLGSSLNQWNTVYANIFSGTATTAQNLRIGSTNYPGSTLSEPNTVAVRDSSRNITANTFIGNLSGNANTVTNGVYTSRSITAGTGLTGGGNLSQDRTISLSGIALSLNNLSTNGFITRTGTDTVVSRTISGAANQVNVLNGDGVAGNPIISLAIPTQLEAQTGSDNTKPMTALRTKEVIDNRVATEAEALTGINNSKFMTPFRTAQVLENLRGIGYNQTWIQYTITQEPGGRWAYVDYQNNTSRPIMVAAVTGGAGPAQVSADGQNWVTVAIVGDDSDADNCSFIVPPNHYYRINSGLNYWAELR